MCNATATRNRPIKFNVDTSGYYKLCNCKQSANAPFCNGTHRYYTKNILKDKWFVNTIKDIEVSMNFGVGQHSWEQPDSLFGISTIETKYYQ